VTALLAIVPARGGSKRLPGKNLRLLAGRPLIEWTAKSLVESELAAECLLTTDDAEIAEAGRKVGWRVPFLRPPELARDESPTIDAVIHALDWRYASRGSDPEIVIVLQLTSPFRSGADIRDAVTLLDAHRDANAVVGMKPCGDGRHGRWIVDGDGFVCRADGPAANEDYELNGAVYAIRTGILREARDFYPPRTLAHVMPAERSLDIDDADDWRRAEALAKEIA
jgi:CMP-N,N'-diacetyllegionaminic acid synthase